MRNKFSIFQSLAALRSLIDAKISGPSSISASRLLGRQSGSPGSIQEIVLGTNLTMVGTTLNATGGSGSFSATQVVVNLPYPAKRSHRVIVTDGTVSPSSKLIVNLAGVSDLLANVSDDIDLLFLTAVPQSGQFELQASFLVPHAGPFTINYAIG